MGNLQGTSVLFSLLGSDNPPARVTITPGMTCGQLIELLGLDPKSVFVANPKNPTKPLNANEKIPASVKDGDKLQGLSLTQVG